MGTESKRKSMFEINNDLMDMLEGDAPDEYVSKYIEKHLSSKLDGIIYVTKELEGKAKILKDEAAALKDRAAWYMKESKRVKDHIYDLLKSRGIPEMAGELAQIKINKSGGLAPVIIDNEDKIPQEYRKPGVPDKTKIREYLEGGGALDSARLGTRGDYLKIRLV